MLEWFWNGLMAYFGFILAPMLLGLLLVAICFVGVVIYSTWVSATDFFRRK